MVRRGLLAEWAWSVKLLPAARLSLGVVTSRAQEGEKDTERDRRASEEQNNESQKQKVLHGVVRPQVPRVRSHM